MCLLPMVDVIISFSFVIYSQLPKNITEKRREELANEKEREEKGRGGHRGGGDFVLVARHGR